MYTARRGGPAVQWAATAAASVWQNLPCESIMPFFPGGQSATCLSRTPSNLSKTLQSKTAQNLNFIKFTSRRQGRPSHHPTFAAP